jgi:Family of unknown function (DUF6152)
MKKLLIAPVLIGVALAAASPMFAHHGSRVSYDLDKTVTVTGAVTEYQWQNPHVYVMFDVTDESGKVTTWAAETYSPVVMTRNGWGHRSFKAGDKVTVTLWPSKIGTPRGFLAKLVFPDGHVTDLTHAGGPE